MRILHAIGHYIKHTDLYLLLVALTCSAYGLVLVYSATLSYGTDRYIIIQSVSVVLGVFAFVIMSLIDLENASRYWPWILLFNILLQCLLFTPLGMDSGGNRSWLDFKFTTVQPAELGKILFIVSFSAHISRMRDSLNHWQTLLILMLHAMTMVGTVVVTSSDLGMALTYLAITAVMLFGAGLSLKWFAAGGVLTIASIPFLYQFLYGSGTEMSRRLRRILVIFDPSIDPDIYFQTEQSKIAIGAGQFSGQGFLQGNQTQYSRLPVKQSDFIFSVAGEEFGMIGCVLILVLLGLLILRLLYVSFTGATTFSALLAIGIAGMFLFQTFENIFMCLGMFPVMGLTLPLFSYGGTSVITMYAALGIAAGVRMREKPSWLQT